MPKSRAIVLLIQIAVAVVGTVLLWNSGAIPSGIAYAAAAFGLLALAALVVYALKRKRPDRQ
jgi:membrane associated rhomboid family serine protease